MEVARQDLEELQRLEESLWVSETRFNREYMEGIFARDFFEFGRSGRIYDREFALSAPAQEINAKLPLRNFNAHRISDNVVLVAYVSEVLSNDGLQIGNRSSLWIKTGPVWQLRFHQGTPVNE